MAHRRLLYSLPKQNNNGRDNNPIAAAMTILQAPSIATHRVTPKETLSLGYCIWILIEVPFSLVYGHHIMFLWIIADELFSINESIKR